MVWNVNDWNTEEEDRHWEMTEEDTDDEFDDIALSRLGVDLPACAKETARPQFSRTPTTNSELFNRWQEVLNGMEIAPELQEALESVRDGGTFSFGDEPRGIDPEEAGFEGTEESCEECGMLLYECVCGLDANVCHDCGVDWDECMCNRCHECELLLEDCDCDVADRR